MHKEEARQHMLERIPTALEDETVDVAQKRILKPKAKWDALGYVYVLSKAGKLKGVASIKDVFAAAKRGKMKQFNIKKPVAIHPHSTLPVAAARAIHHNLRSIPVIDKNKTFLGVIGTDTIFDTLEREHVRDLLSVSGISSEKETFVDVFSAKLTKVVKWRTPWLLVGVLGGVLTTSIVGGFEDQLAEVIELAFFLPVVLYMGAAVGNQTQMLYIRGISYQHATLGSYLIKEFLADLFIGIILALGLGIFATIMTSSLLIGIILTTAIFAITATAGPLAILISAIFIKLKQDPAIGGGPFATIAQDIVSILIYFLTATLFLF